MLRGLQTGGQQLLLLLLRGGGTLLIILLISTVICRMAYVRFVPKQLLREPVYFDFRPSRPTATIRLGSRETQWRYLKPVPISPVRGVNAEVIYESQQHDVGKNDIDVLPIEGDNTILSAAINAERVLLPLSTYNIDGTLKFSRSPRNYQLGKVVVTLTVIDASDEAIAESVRTVAIPFKSSQNKIFEDIYSSVLRFIGLHSSSAVVDSESVYVILMNNFVEPALSNPPSSTLELSLSTSDIDLLGMEIRISPVLGSIT